MTTAEELCHDYWDQGFVVTRGTVGPTYLADLRSCCDKRISKPSSSARNLTRNGSGLYLSDTHLWKEWPELIQHLKASAIVQLAAQLLGATEMRIYTDQILVKAPNTLEETFWHQDLPYLPLFGRQFLTAWIALDDCTERLGSMMYCPKSHFWAPHRHRPIPGIPNPLQDLECLPDIDSDYDAYNVAKVSLQAGDCIFHHGMICHGGKGNSDSHAFRRAYVLRFFGEDVIFDPRPGTNSLPFVEGARSGQRLTGPNYPVVFTRDAR